MEKITDPMISCNGRIYSLAGLKRLLGRVTNSGCSRDSKISKRKTPNGKI